VAPLVVIPQATSSAQMLIAARQRLPLCTQTVLPRLTAGGAESFRTTSYFVRRISSTAIF
jgi:hypothetical protein